MSRLYSEKHRELHDRFDTRRLADRLEAVTVRSEIDAAAKAFIESRDMFFLSTVDPSGRPTVSYKGGDPGFVRVLDDQTIAFPSYNGNGMFYSMGNIVGNGQVGLLFIDFETPQRLRFHGVARVETEDPLLQEYPEAELVVRVVLSELFINCPRYIHRYRKVESSRYVPREASETPFAEWKRIDGLQDVLPAADQGRAEQAGGVLTMPEYSGKVQSGEG